MKKAEFQDYVDDMLEAARKIQTFLLHDNFESFSKAEKTKFAIIPALKIIGKLLIKFLPASKRSIRISHGVQFLECGIN